MCEWLVYWNVLFAFSFSMHFSWWTGVGATQRRCMSLCQPLLRVQGQMSVCMVMVFACAHVVTFACVQVFVVTGTGWVWWRRGRGMVFGMGGGSVGGTVDTWKQVSVIHCCTQVSPVYYVLPQVARLPHGPCQLTGGWVVPRSHLCIMCYLMLQVYFMDHVNSLVDEWYLGLTLLVDEWYQVSPMYDMLPQAAGLPCGPYWLTGGWVVPGLTCVLCVTSGC